MAIAGAVVLQVLLVLWASPPRPKPTSPATSAPVRRAPVRREVPEEIRWANQLPEHRHDTDLKKPTLPDEDSHPCHPDDRHA